MSDYPRPTILNFITGNAQKLAEVKTILVAVPGLQLQSRNVEGAEIQGSIEEVARDKCSRAAAAVGLCFLYYPRVGRKGVGLRGGHAGGGEEEVLYVRGRLAKRGRIADTLPALDWRASLN